MLIALNIVAGIDILKDNFLTSSFIISFLTSSSDTGLNVNSFGIIGFFNAHMIIKLEYQVHAHNIFFFN